MKSFIYLFFLFLSFNSFAQNDIEWMKTEGIIQKTQRKRKGKIFATVIFKTNENLEITTHIELIRIPLLGSLKSTGDTITVYYNKNNPAIAKSDSGKFISKYGMFILIALGIFYSIKRILKLKKAA